MASDPSNPLSGSGRLQDMLSRLKGVVTSLHPPGEDTLPASEANDRADIPSGPGTSPVAGNTGDAAGPVDTLPLTQHKNSHRSHDARQGEVGMEKQPPRQEACEVCGTPRAPHGVSCSDCGYFFPASGSPTLPYSSPAPGPTTMRIKQRYELGELINERRGVCRFQGRDYGLNGTDYIPVLIIRETVMLATVVDETVPADELADLEEILPTFDLPSSSATTVSETLPGGADWPTATWERMLLDKSPHPGLPLVFDHFFEDGNEYLIEEIPSGRLLWDLWDDPQTTHQDRYTWLTQAAEIIQHLHRLSAMPEAITPGDFIVDEGGRVRLTHLDDLLPLPIPQNAPLHGGLYTAPELIAGHGHADARASLFSFGAMMYALYLGRELTEREFLSPGNPRPIFNDDPDMHPVLGRLFLKTFNRQLLARFPSDEASRSDPTGFSELIHTLQICARIFDRPRLEIGAWTTTGLVRTGNEDAFALLHSCESRQDDVAESALILLADGMGGYEAGEVAAALAIATLRKTLTAQRPFAALSGLTGFESDQPGADGNPPPPVDVEEIKTLLRTALKETNRHVFNASRAGVGRRGMGCTVEVVYVNGRQVVVGHVGDSRTYHIAQGRTIQITRDHTLVNRLVELGTLTEEEAETHPRRNELQQAIGGQPEVEPGIYHVVMRPGDYLVVCSDGLSNHVKSHELRQFLQGHDGLSAERAARRLMNLVNLEGSTDNATVVVVRAT